MLICPNVDKSCYVKSGDIINGDEQGFDPRKYMHISTVTRKCRHISTVTRTYRHSSTVAKKYRHSSKVAR